MITRLQVRNYRLLYVINQTLSPFQALIGANATGKSTFMDALGFLSDAIKAKDLREAIEVRAPDFRNLVWQHANESIEFAVEARVPDSVANQFKFVRYETEIGVKEHQVAFLNENLWVIPDLPEPTDKSPKPKTFPLSNITYDSLLTQTPPEDWLNISSKSNRGIDKFLPETRASKIRFNFKFGIGRSSFGSIPEDPKKFPTALWFKELLGSQIQKVNLNSEKLRTPSSALDSKTHYETDGSNLPHLIHLLETQHQDVLKDWVAHIQTALPDIETVRTIERPEDRARYLIIEYAGGIQVPSWMVSDGTLRLLALTILAYLPNIGGVYLIEEPENGIHPRAVETVIQSLKSVYNAQIFIATHSPVILNMLEPSDLLCFARTPQGFTDIVRGDLHPSLEKWKGEISLGTLFGSGVLS
jgi:predicted ATPase